MQLDMEDKQLKASLKTLSGGRTRLVLDYPSEAEYRDRVLGALFDLFRPTEPMVATKRDAKP